MAPSVMHHKGLLNGPGQNNCFLNSAVQVLWHLDIFRRSFRELSGHACMADSCIFCALKDLFGQLQFSHERALPPDALRKALAQSFSDQHRFQLGFMDDAAECFENILLRIHFHIAYNEAEDMCNAKHCIPHQKFAMTLVEQSVCGVCHATSEPLPFTQMVHYVSASALISQAKQFVGTSHPDLFGQLLKKAGGMGDIRDCPSACGAKIQIRRTLINRPEIVSVGIVWDSDRPSLEHIMSLLDTLRIHLRLSDVFHGSFDVHHADNVYHQLVGVVTYYGKHYSTFFFHTKLRVWVYFDDANVREVGPHWQDVVEKCRRGRYQPLLLLFATPNGTPVDASHAPKSVTLVDKPAINLCNGHDIVGKPPIQRCSLSPTGSLALGGRRSLTPSPEKPRSGDGVNQRRAVTPNPEQSTNQINEKSVLPNNDYQNLVQYQDVIFNRSNICEDESDRKPDIEKRIHPVRKELSRRDSGNWSGDRNSASSSSSTSLENPYHYIIGKMHLKTYGGIPRSPNKNGDLSSGSGNSSGGPADPGYDSFSLSSTDSLPIQQNLKYNFQLAQIPENQQTPAGSNHIIDENTRVADDCERLCAEVDQLLDRSEQAEDLITALSLCNAAVNKARAAMDAPYSNPQTASFATMKHNACILRARSLHRKLEEPLHNNLKYGENRHSREGSGCSGRGSTGSHSRQNSKDKGNHGHSRQNSVELLDIHSNNNQPTKSVIQPMKTSPDLKSSNDKISTCKNIEIYATLPKNKKSILSRSSPKVKNVVEDEEYLMKERPGRSLLGNRSKTNKKEIEKRTRSEERNTKNVKEVAVVTTKEKEKEQKELKKQAKQEEKQNKKQHKIRRKLLMGGLMRRKNRSMPDLRDEEGMTKELPKTSSVKETSKDDSMVNSKTAIQSNLSGYLSEGNLEYNGNPNLERSKLMRKSFHGSKIIPFNKVPPPPPLRTTSQLSKTDRILNDPRNIETSVYAKSRSWCQEPASLPFLPRNYEDEKPNTDAVTYSKGGYLLQQSSMNTVVTEAQIHHDASFQSLPSSTDEPDFINKVEDINFQLPPYPSPIHSTVHSRQASEDFPPPPATLPPPELESDFLIMLQEKCERMGIMEMNSSAAENEIKKPTGGESWLKELQAKQAERRKLNDQIESISINGNESKNVKDMKSKFEQMQVIDEVDYISKLNGQIHLVKESVRSPPSSVKAVDKCESHSNLKISNSYDMEDDKNGFEGKEQKRKSGKKKNVTFCEQVVLVATADDEEADSYIPNPILERVLRSVLHKESNFENKEHAVHSVVPLKRTDSMRLSQGLPLKPQLEGEDVVDGTSMQKDTTRSLNMRSANTINSSTRGNFVSEPVDEVDGPCVMNQTYGDGKAIVKQNTNSYVNSHQAYSPTYIPASSLCLPSKNEHRNEYSEQAVLLNESNISQNGYIDSHNEQSNNGISQNQPIRKFNENYSSADNLRYSPICNQEVSHHNGFHSTYSPYQSVPTSYSNSASSSYQPMSLQYYPTQSRSSPQITTYRDQLNQGNVKTSLSSNSLSSSLSRQNSTASHYNKQLTAVDPRRLPVSSISPQASMSSTSRLSDCQRSQYYNMPQYSQKSTNSVTAYQSTLNGNCSPYGYNNDTSKCISNSSMNGQQNLLNSSGISHNLHQQYSPSISTHQIHAQQSNTCHVSQCSPNSQYTSSSLNHSNLSGHQVHNSTSSSSYNIPTISSSQPQYTSNSSNNQHNSNSCGIPQSTQNQHYSSNVSHPHVSSQQYSTHSTNFSHQGSSNSSVAAQLHQNIPSQQHLPNLNHGNSHVSNNSMHQQSLHQNLPSHLTNGNSHQNINVQQNGSSNCDSLPRNSTPLMAPYQSIPYNSNVYEVYSRNSYNGTSSAYQHVPYGSTNGVNSNPSNQQHQTKMQHRANLPPVYQHPPPPPPNSKSSVYQRVPTPNQKIRTNEYNNTSSTNKYFPYQHPPMPKQMDSKKTNAAVPCNLCRKKQISPPSVYCTDCDFYISRFKQKV